MIVVCDWCNVRQEVGLPGWGLAMSGTIGFGSPNGDGRQERPPNVVVAAPLARVGSAPLAALRWPQNPERRTQNVELGLCWPTQNSEPRTRNSGLRTANPEPVTRNLAASRRTKNPELRTQNVELRFFRPTRNPEPVTRNLAALRRTQNSELRTQNAELGSCCVEGLCAES
jgi:hypothetical protein